MSTALIPGWYIEFQAAVLRQLPRPAEIDQLTAEGWTNNQKSLKKKLVECLLPEPTSSVEPTDLPVMPAHAGQAEKFALLVDLGIVTVPDDYDHATALESFKKRNDKKFYHCSDSMTDKRFPNPTRVLKPGDQLRVRAFQQVVPGKTTSEERMMFLATQKAIHTGAQGATLIFDQKRDQLPKGKGYYSFDEPERLWKDCEGYHRVPGVYAQSDCHFYFNLGGFEDAWYGDVAFLCFCDVE